MAGGSGQNLGQIAQGFQQSGFQTPQQGATSGYSNYASPNQNFMSYPQSGSPGQPNNPPQGAMPPTLTSNLPPVGSNQSPDMTGNGPSIDMGFDHSGSDAGVGGQPVNQMQSPLQPTNTNSGGPPRLSDYMSPQGLQIQGNPTSQPVNRGSRSI